MPCNPDLPTITSVNVVDDRPIDGRDYPWEFSESSVKTNPETGIVFTWGESFGSLMGAPDFSIIGGTATEGEDYVVHVLDYASVYGEEPCTQAYYHPDYGLVNVKGQAIVWFITFIDDGAFEEPETIEIKLSHVRLGAGNRADRAVSITRFEKFVILDNDAPPVPDLFTEADDRVDFRHLTDDQRRAISNGRDFLSALAGNDTVHLGSEADRQTAGVSIEVFQGGKGNDHISSTGTGGIRILGQEGDDTLLSGQAGDTLLGGSGSDTFSGVSATVDGKN